MAAKGIMLKGALASDPKAKNRPMERVSPGVYRSAGGDLVSQKGRVLQRPAPQPQQQSMNQNMGATIAAAANGTPNPNYDPNAARQLFGDALPQVQQDPHNMNFAELVKWGQQQQQQQQAQELWGQLPEKWKNFQRPQNWNPDPGFSQNYQAPNIFGMPQMPQASANHGGQYRLSPGVYGTREQAMNQYNQQVQQMQLKNAAAPMRRRG